MTDTITITAAAWRQKAPEAAAELDAEVEPAFDGGETQKIEPVQDLNPYRNTISGYGNTAAEVARELGKLAHYAGAIEDLPDLPGKSTTESQTAMLERVAYLCEQLSLQIDAALQKAEELAEGAF